MRLWHKRRRRQEQPLDDALTLTNAEIRIGDAIARIDAIDLQLNSHANCRSTCGPPQLGERAELPLRQRKEIEAAAAANPGGEWEARVYVTVTGDLRWRCCGNLFVDDHGPWCGVAGDRL